MKLIEYAHVIMKDGREGAIVEVLGERDCIIDLGSSPADWESGMFTIDDIASIIPPKT